jgi:hypothetical protein
MLPERKEVIKKITSLIEDAFPESLVRRIGTGCPDDDYSDGTEVFEAYMIEDDVLGRFKDFVWKINNEIAEPEGFSIMVHTLSPEDTKEYRLEQYNNEKEKRLFSYYIFVKSERTFIETVAQKGFCEAAMFLGTDTMGIELYRYQIRQNWDENGINGDNDSDALQGTILGSDLSIKVAS